MAIRSGGIASGLDTNAIIDALVANERIPISKLQSQRTDFRTQLTKLGIIKSALSELDTAATKLGSLGGVMGYSATSANSSVVAVNATGEATPGTHQLKVFDLASAERDRSVAFASSDEAVKAGTLTIRIAGESDVAIDIAEGATLSEIASSINNSGAKARANVLYDGSNYYLDISATETGYEGADPSSAIELIESYTGLTGTELALSEVQTASNASFEFDGLTMTRRSNSFSDVVTGLSLTLQGESATDVEINVDVNTDAVVENVTTFVNAYNRVMQLLENELAVGEDTTRRSSLAGDSSLRGLKASLSASISTSITSGTGPVNLSALGIKTERTGQLSINESTLREIATSNPSGFAAVFTDTSNGISARVQTISDRYLDYVDGTFKLREEGINRSIDALDTHIGRLETRLARYEEGLIRQFTALEEVMSGLQAQQSYLSAYIGSKES